MKKLCASLLLALLLVSLMAACGKNNGNAAPDSHATSAAPQSAAAEEAPGGVQDVSLPGETPLPEEPAYVDDGEGAANVADAEVVSDFNFTMDFPEGWSYTSLEELGLEAVYVFAAENKITGSSIIVSQPLDAEGAALDGYAETTYAAFEDVIRLYETMGIATELYPMRQDTLGGQAAWCIELDASSSEVDFTQTTYLVQTTGGEILTVAVTTYDEQDAATAAACLASISWN